MRSARAVAVGLALGLALGLPARAGGEPARRATERPPHRAYFITGGAIPFFWVSGFGALGASLFLSPPETPRIFSADEGGKAPSTAHRVPEWTVALGSGALSLGVLALPDSSVRWYHFKGYLESLVTTTFLTEATKVTFGRHRPDYDLTAGADNPDDERKSFFSGHASLTLASTTYFALFLRYHGLDRFRPHGSFAWWEPIPYAGLAALSVYVPWTRVVDHRHNVSDVLTGAAVGATASTIFFYWQERRWRDAGGELDEEPSIALVPGPGGRGLALFGTF